MKKVFLFFVLISLSLSNNCFAKYQCFEVEMDPVLQTRGTRILKGRTLDISFRSNKVKLVFNDFYGKTKFQGRIVTSNEVGNQPFELGWIESEMYTLVIKTGYFFENLSGRGLMMATFYLHGDMEIPMFCNFMSEKNRWLRN